MARLDDLSELREQLRAWIPEAPVDRRAALVAQYRACIAEIESLTPKEQVGDGIDQIAARREARRAGTAADKGGAKRSG